MYIRGASEPKFERVAANNIGRITHGARVYSASYVRTLLRTPPELFYKSTQGELSQSDINKDICTYMGDRG